MAASSTPKVLSDQDKIRLACDMLRQAPPGEFHEVFTDVREILHNDQLLQEKALSAFIAYDEDMFTPVTLPDGRKTLVTKFGRIGLGLYVDPATNMLFKFDHVKKEAGDARPNERNALYELTEPSRRQYEILIAAYVAKQYPAGTAAVYAKSVQSEDEVIVCIEDHKFAPTNFYNGLWRSEWHLSPGTGAVTGSLRVAFHYYEDGNLHLQARKEAATTLPVGSPDAMAKALVLFIRKTEKAFQQAQLDQFATLSEDSFRSLRRSLPANRCKLDWSQLVLYEVGKKLATR